MKYLLIILFLITTNELFGINSYRIGDELVVNSSGLNIRSGKSKDSKTVGYLSFGDTIIVKENKYDKGGDSLLLPVTNEIESLNTGRWVEIESNGIRGHVFDYYLSIYNYAYILNERIHVQLDSLYHEDYSTYNRYVKGNGIIIEIGEGLEWGMKMLIIPDISIEEAIRISKFLAEERLVNPKWEITNSEIKMIEKNDGWHRSLNISQKEKYFFIKFGYGT